MISKGQTFLKDGKVIACERFNRKVEIPINKKYMLTINEAAEYFNIGIKKMRRLAEENKGSFAIFM